MSFHDKVVVITGAGSGIGRALALELGRRGARLALSDVNDAGLKETAERVNAPVHTAYLDVADRDAVEAYAAAVAAHHGVVHQIYNNAGVSGGGQTILDSDWASFDRTLSINLYGVIHGTKAFLPHLIASGDGHVINVSSLNGFMAQPTLGPYCASKFAVRGFTEVLRTEMLHAGHPVRVTVVHPGGVKTDIASASLRHAEEAGLSPSADQRARARTYNEKLLNCLRSRPHGSSPTAWRPGNRGSWWAATRNSSIGWCGCCRAPTRGSSPVTNADCSADQDRTGDQDGRDDRAATTAAAQHGQRPHPGVNELQRRPGNVEVVVGHHSWTRREDDSCTGAHRGQRIGQGVSAAVVARPLVCKIVVTASSKPTVSSITCSPGTPSRSRSVYHARIIAAVTGIGGSRRSCRRTVSSKPTCIQKVAAGPGCSVTRARSRGPYEPADRMPSRIT
ncbi:short-chain dehydrogenase/reductase SDR [Actinoplanes sp. SE50]|uniref:SDR family NAD(P)-dependent oxidoreductase n=1 Tax=unclassified Actinoplanes TaxID=2626549 RepID=UPI00023ECB43|nr:MULTISPECIES: SDR family oxidoreductase [unclassified Actinoplanes]AEV84812.1 short-chain dehydrogenase/reductase SDR [Actinoplanes sp. SE50/110]ATO83204.1 short-chain dehydrogenase/reductase SDR [Actinoplanes sp. SE50]SLM00611.1 Putative oxidoreductase SadH [Actinoplanes sp. SE50/110]